MKSSIVKVVAQTQFETCVTTFIALDFKLRREKSPRWDLRSFPYSKAFLITVHCVNKTRVRREKLAKDSFCSKNLFKAQFLPSSEIDELLGSWKEIVHTGRFAVILVFTDNKNFFIK